MTSKSPSVNGDQSDGKASRALAEEPKSDATDESKQPEAGDDADDSLEAILLQASAKAPEAAPPKPLGSKTLMGIGIEGLNLPAILREEAQKHKEKQKEINKELNKDTKAKTAKARKKSATAEAEPDVPVNDLVEEGSTATDPVQAAANVSVPETKSGRSLLDDVAQALNVQASEVRDKARGRLPGMTHAGAGAGAPGRGRLPFLSRGSGASDTEFEDPSEGPTALTPGMIAIAEAEKATGQKSAQDAELEAEEEAVVLGHAVQSGSAKYAQARTADSRPLTVPRVPGLSAATPVVVGPPPGVVVKVSTPVGGLPLPSSGRTRLPTPMPGPTANSGSHPMGAINYQTLPFGMASPVVSDLTATAPSTPISLEASRRFAATANSSVGADAVPVRRTARVTEPVVRLGTVFPAVLTAHVKLATLSLAGLIAVTFAGGLFVGIVVGKGQGRVEPPIGTHAGISTPVTPAAAAVQPAGAATAVGATAAVQPASAAAAVGAAAAPAAPSPAAALPSKVSPAVVPAIEPTGALPQAVVSPLPPTPPPENEIDGKTAKHPATTARTPHPKKTPAPASATATASESLVPAPKVAAVKSTAHPTAAASESPAPAPKVAAVKSTAHPTAGPSNASKPVTGTSSSKPAATAVSGKPATASALSKPMANNATSKPATKSKTKTTWHDPFAD